MTIFNVDIEEYYDPFQASIYPNPAKEKINISIESGFENVILRIFNATGSIIYSAEITNGREKIDLVDFSPGMYNLEIISTNYRTTKRFIVH